MTKVTILRACMAMNLDIKAAFCYSLIINVAPTGCHIAKTNDCLRNHHAAC